MKELSYVLNNMSRKVPGSQIFIPKTGAYYIDGNQTCIFSAWAPEKKKMTLHLTHPVKQQVEMRKDEWGYFKAELKGILPGTRYLFSPEGKTALPDPASHSQPEGVHGPSEVIDHGAFNWTDNDWKGIPFNHLILYELHTGTFTADGTFAAIIPLLDELADTGINAIELMPVSQFPGKRNWGYDGVYPYSVQNSYGGPDGLKQLVNACHQKGIAVFLDVVYNHLGPEGNYFPEFGPWFTDIYYTPWGNAFNFDRDWSDGVREYFSDNPLHWFQNYHIDGLRFDAIHAIYDSGAVSIWELICQKVKLLEQKLGRRFYLTAESDFNNPRVIRSPEAGGSGFDAQWMDDFHHALYVLLDKKGKERYEDFGQIGQLAKAYTDGFVHSGEYVKARKRKHGTSSAGVPGNKFIIFNQNHDQVGNRVMGERLSVLVDFERLKIAAAAIFLSPYIPMLFMGEEYGEQNPFFYFVDHSEEALIKTVQEGRKKEFENLRWNAEPPDPASEETFNKSKIRWDQRTKGRHLLILQWHKALISLRNLNPVFGNFTKSDVRVNCIGEDAIILHRQNQDGNRHALCYFNLSEKSLTLDLPFWGNNWIKIIDSKEQQWLENKEEATKIISIIAAGQNTVHLAPLSVVVYGCES